MKFECKRRRQYVSERLISLTEVGLGLTDVQHEDQHKKTFVHFNTVTVSDFNLTN